MSAADQPSSSTAADALGRSGSRGKLFIIAGPSGSGKSSISTRIVELGLAKLSVSYTTRARRAAEVDGVHYRFITREKFDEMRASNAFLESANVHGNWYATYGQDVERDLAGGSTVLLEIDVKGAEQVRDRGRTDAMIFILPPSIAELKRRLAARGSEDESQMRVRLQTALREIARISMFDYLVVNEDVVDATAAVAAVIRGEGAQHARAAQPALAAQWEKVAGENLVE